MNFEIEQDSPVGNASVNHLHAEDLYKLVQELPSSSKAVFCLYVMDGYKHKEIADMLSITVGTSKWHLANARKELKRRILKQREQEHQVVYRRGKLAYNTK